MVYEHRASPKPIPKPTIEKIDDIFIIGQAQTDDIAISGKRLERFFNDVRRTRYGLKCLGASSPNVKLKTSLGDRLSHRSTLVAKPDKSNPNDFYFGHVFTRSFEWQLPTAASRYRDQWRKAQPPCNRQGVC